MQLRLSLIYAGISLVASAALAADLPVARARYLMGTTCEIEVAAAGDDADAIGRAFAEGARIETMLTTWRSDSELSMLNSRGRAVVSEHLYDLLRVAMSWCGRTDGTFNPLIRPLIDAWKTRDEGALPSASTVDAALRRVDPRNVRFERSNVIALSNGGQFEEGAFGKGYAIARMLEVLGHRSALINFGGQLAISGSREVTIASPEDRSSPAVAFTMKDASLSTSSGSEKSFHIGGKRFSHLIDPRNGDALPPNGSVSVLDADPLVADILSTALYVMGPAIGTAWADRNHVAALFIGTDAQVRATARFRTLAPDLHAVDSRYTVQE